MFNPRSRNHRQVLCELGGGSLLSLQQQSLTPQDFVALYLSGGRIPQNVRIKTRHPDQT